MTCSPNKKQIKILTSFMEEHNDLAKSFCSNQARKERNGLWEELKTKLNLNGPPVKTTAEWKRAWTLRKYRTKKKLVSSNKSKTSGGKYSIENLSENDKAVISACGMEATVRGMIHQDANEHAESKCIASLEQKDYEGACHQVSEKESNFNEESTSNWTNQNNKRCKLDLLSKHINLQKQFAMENKNYKDKIFKALIDLKEVLVEQNMCQNRFQEQCLTSQMEFQQQALKILGSLHDGVKCHIETNEYLNREIIDLKKTEIELKRSELEILKVNNGLKLEIPE